jgi:formyltetrahydrofolate hydrolase
VYQNCICSVFNRENLKEHETVPYVKKYKIGFFVVFAVFFKNDRRSMRYGTVSHKKSDKFELSTYEKSVLPQKFCRTSTKKLLYLHKNFFPNFAEIKKISIKSLSKHKNFVVLTQKICCTSSKK